MAPGEKTPKDVWNDALKRLKKFEPGVFGPLSQGKFAGYQDGVYRAQFPPEAAIFITMLSAPERRGKVEQALRDCGADPDARFEPGTQETAAVSAAARQQGEKHMESLIDMFGRDKVQIDE